MVLSFISILMLASCAVDEFGNSRSLNRAEKGAMIGATTGAIIGYRKDGKKKAILYGLVGGLAGGAIGSYMDSQRKDFEKQLESEIQANYAIYYSEEKLWHATGNVVAQNYKTGERLDSEELFWDENKEQIFSESYTRIVNENGTFYGQNGFISNQSLTDYELIGSSGIVNIKDDE